MAFGEICGAVDELSALCRLAWERGFMAGWSGNASAKIGEDTFLITAAGAIKGLLAPGDFVLSRLNGELLGDGCPSSEWRLHARIYEALPGARFVLHTHPAAMQAVELIGAGGEDFLDAPIYEAKVWRKRLAVARETRPGEAEVGVEGASAAKRAAKEGLPCAVWLPLHGLCAIGVKPMDTFALTDELERLAEICLRIKKKD